ncbi:hypothetical protein B0T19DRAFT_459690 [Cercophora scortea]|uniref:Uncharacterized protein n=1 Tax=Cercophora scortea TaxID=314031 RepID=A0AAE0IZH6_9PEZI|nr:hypothetical protein B0T19DRAFT_459690 [Cercophora scortea]
MEIQHCGRKIPPFCLVEVKTHRQGNSPMFAPEAQLYFTRRNKLFVAQHRSGLFEAVDSDNEEVVKDMSEKLVAWEQENQPTLVRVVALLKELWTKVEALATDTESGMRLDDVSIVCECDGSGEIEGVKVGIFELENGEGVRLLPAGL